MKVKLFIYVGPTKDKVGALVRFFNPNSTESEIDLVMDFGPATLTRWLELKKGRAYELIENKDGLFGVQQPSQTTFCRRERAWMQKYDMSLSDSKVTSEMFTLKVDGGKREIYFHNDSPEPISAFDLHDREGPIPNESGDYAMLFIPRRGGKVVNRIVKPITLRKSVPATT